MTVRRSVYVRKKAGEADIAKESLDHPSYLGAYFVDMTWRDLAPEQAMLA